MCLGWASLWRRLCGQRKSGPAERIITKTIRGRIETHNQFREFVPIGRLCGGGAGTTSHTETDSYIHEFCSRVPQFKQSLRIGATAPLEQQAFLIIKHLWEQGGGGGGTGSSTDIATLRDALAMITCRGADKLLHDVLDRLGAVEEEEAAHGLERILSRMVDAEACTNDEMKTLSSALARCEPSAKKPTLMKLLHAAALWPQPSCSGKARVPGMRSVRDSAI